ncbi:MAG: diacylglycerol/lipid kinase family protein [Promethearchaeota archaeon]|jgi:diacylglycerol kinase (ATP)
MEDYALIYNPLAGSKKKGTSDIDLTRQCLDDLKVSYKIFQTEYAGHAIELADQLGKDGYRIIGAGGDGTCNEVLHGVISSGSGAVCGFIPMGSGNDVPAVIGITPDIKRACEIIAEGYTGKSDIGLALKDDGIKRYFLGVGGNGFDAEVARRANENKEKNYNAMVLKALIAWRSKNLKVIMDNDTYEGPANLVAVGNGGSYGGGMYICQKAKVDDGLFDISIVNIKKLKLLFQFKKMYSGSLSPHTDVYEHQSKKVRIEMTNPNDTPYLCQVDGEMLGPIPVTYETLKDGQEFIRPKINEVAEAFKEKYGQYFWECDH